MALAVQGSQLGLDHAKLISDSRHVDVLVIADREGRFSLPPNQQPSGIVAVEESGYAEFRMDQFKNGSKIVLQPWGRVEGVLRVGSQPGANEELHLAVFDRPGSLDSESIEFVSPALDAVADRDGKFVFTYVPPGAWRLLHAAVGDRIAVTAGETNRIAVGGAGRPLLAG